MPFSPDPSCIREARKANSKIKSSPSKALIGNSGGSATILTYLIKHLFVYIPHSVRSPTPKEGARPTRCNLPFRLAGESPGDAARERHSPVWRQAKRQSGDWRSRALAIFILRLIILVSPLHFGIEARLTLLWRWHKVAIQTEKR
jgi:hypothetical protein